MKRLEQLPSLTIRRQSLGIEESAILVRRKGTQEQRVDVNWAITSGPFQALKAASKVIRRSWLTAAIARQKGGGTHVMGKS
jgi:hypothetical protein